MGRGRPKKTRIIAQEPAIRQFSPRGRIGRPGSTDLKKDEYEAIRLADHKRLRQAEAAARMHISQQTFSRILRSAHKNIAQALIDGSIIRISGGDYSIEK